MHSAYIDHVSTIRAILGDQAFAAAWEKTERGELSIPDLIRYQLWHGPRAGEPTTGRGEIERIARACQAAECHDGLGSTVVETRFNVVRSSVPHRMATLRKLRDYLPPLEGGHTPVRGEASPAPTVITVGA